MPSLSLSIMVMSFSGQVLSKLWNRIWFWRKIKISLSLFYGKIYAWNRFMQRHRRVKEWEGSESECMIMGQVCKWKPQKGKNKAHRKSLSLSLFLLKCSLSPFLRHFNTLLHHRHHRQEGRLPATHVQNFSLFSLSLALVWQQKERVNGWSKVRQTLNIYSIRQLWSDYFTCGSVLFRSLRLVHGCSKSTKFYATVIIIVVVDRLKWWK